MLYVIYNKYDNQLFWSNTQGWVESPDEEYFTQEEINFLNLPLDGVWAKVGD